MMTDKDHIQQLLSRLEAGSASRGDLDEIERLLEAGTLNPEDIGTFSLMNEQLMRMDYPSPSASLDHRFRKMLAREQADWKGVGWKNFFLWPDFLPRLATTFAVLVIGLTAGYFLRPAGNTTPDAEIAALSEQLTGLQEMMMLSLLEKGSATERLKAVNLTQEMSEASRKVTAALIQTLNEDENVNVRLAALDALKPYASDPAVRQALIQSIGKQESPLMQVSLAELMVALQEKSAVKEFEKIVDAKDTPGEIRKKLMESIKILI